MTRREVRGREDHSLAFDTIFSILSNPRRRFVLHYLKQGHGPISTGDLAARGAAWEYGVTPEEVTNKQRKRVYTSLHQNHLPKMDSHGLVEYDRERTTVSIGERAERLDFYLEVIPERDLPWHEYFLGLSVLSLVLTLAAWSSAFPFDAIPDLWYAVLISTLFLLSSLVYTHRARAYRLGGETLPPSLRRE